MRSSDLITTVTKVLGSAPEWVRTDLASKDEIVRERAEETLAAMIAVAVTQPSPSDVVSQEG